MIASRIARYLTGILLLLLFLLGTAMAVAPTQEAINKWRAEGTLDEHLAPLRAFKAAGGCSPSVHPVFDKARFQAKLAENPNAVDTINVVVILVDFTDWQYQDQAVAGTKQDFDSILFSDRSKDAVFNNTGSMTDYYKETSYGRLYVHGEVFGWYRMPQTYAYYIGSDNGLTNSRILARDAVNAANPDVDYSKFIGPDGFVSVVIIHAGPGAETGAYGIWSHKAQVQGTPVFDGAVIYDYTMNPEEFGPSLSPIGVFCHEFGHVLGLPDLYTTTYTPATSEGLGAWSLMASGNYNGDSRLPAHMDPWCKRQVGFLDSFNLVLQNVDSVAIPAVEFNPTVYALPDTDFYPYAKEYFLVENRQRKGFDAGLPGDGLLIYHVDNAVSDNNNYLRYHVGLMQADGLNELALSGSRGNDGDPWPGSTNNRYFGELSVPNSHTNAADASTQIEVWDISNSDSVMHADLSYVYSRPWFIMYGSDSLVLKDTAAPGNNDGSFEAGEPVDFFCHVKNLLRSAYQFSVSLSTDNPDIQFIYNNVAQGNLTIPATLSAGQKSINPVRFMLKPGSKSTISMFTATIRVDSAYGSGDRKFIKSWTFPVMLGAPEVLVVDDDNSQNAEQAYAQALFNLKIPYRIWSKASLGSPTATDLSRYKFVFWAHGTKPTGTLTAADVTALKAFLNGGGNLAIGSASAAFQLRTLDSAFMRDYLHARYVDTLTSGGSYFWGVAQAPVSDGLRWRYVGTLPSSMSHSTKIESVGGTLAFKLGNNLPNPTYTGDCGVVYQGAYKTVFTTFAFEDLNDAVVGWATRDTLVARIMSFFGGNATSIDDTPPRSLPKAFVLGQNYPNPFNPSTLIEYSINYTGRSADSRVRTTLAIYNLTGQRVRTLVDAVQGPGQYRVEWNGRDERGSKVASGVYLYRLTRGDRTESKKMVLLK